LARGPIDFIVIAGLDHEPLLSACLYGFAGMDSQLQEALTRAFNLAYFIHRDKQPSLLIAMGALSKLEVAAAAQDKRLYYTPAGRAPGDACHHRARTKVAMSEFHLLQRLVYVESEPYEKKDEEVGSITRLEEEDMIIRFIKHLVRITTRRNSFYVALGLSRLLYQYSTNETAEIYDLVIQDSDRFKDDYYYRSRKRRLIQELSERFGNLIKLARSKSGEERFESLDDSRGRVPLVSGCLDQFTPWNTTCPLPARDDLRSDEIPSLKFDGSDPDQEHPVEIRRMHSIIHPGCYSRLVTALSLDRAEKKLTVPRFAINSSGDENGRPGDRTTAPPLNNEDLILVASELAENARRRKTSSARLLAIKVDGAQVATIDLDRQTSASFQVDNGAELIEVVTRDATGDLLLATHLLSADEAIGPAPPQFGIQLEGGQRLAFKLSNVPTDAALTDRMVIEISYSEASLLSAAALSARRFLGQTLDTMRPGLPRAWIISRPVLAAGLTLVLAAGILLYLRPWRPPQQALVAGKGVDSPQAADAGSHHDVAAPTSSPDKPESGTGAVPASGLPRPRNMNAAPSSGTPRSSVPRPSSESPLVAHDRRSDQGQETVPDSSAETTETGTRSSSGRVIAKQLAAIKSIYIENLAGGQFGDSVRMAIAQALDGTGELKSVQTMDQADAVLKGRATPGQSNDPAVIKGKLSIKLIAADGSTFWSWPHSESVSSNAVETPQRLAAQVSADLIEKIRVARAR
jgi:hypothetical protein